VPIDRKPRGRLQRASYTKVSCLYAHRIPIEASLRLTHRRAGPLPASHAANAGASVRPRCPCARVVNQPMAPQGSVALTHAPMIEWQVGGASGARRSCSLGPTIKWGPLDTESGRCLGRFLNRNLSRREPGLIGLLAAIDIVTDAFVGAPYGVKRRSMSRHANQAPIERCGTSADGPLAAGCRDPVRGIIISKIATWMWCASWGERAASARQFGTI